MLKVLDGPINEKKAVLRPIDQCIEFAIKWAYANYQT
jgi:hypothetical protein